MIRSMRLFWRRLRGKEPKMGADIEEDTPTRVLKNLKARRDSGEILSRTSEQYLADRRSEE